MLIHLALAATFALTNASVSVRSDPLESVIPYPLDYEGGPGKLAERLLSVRDLCGISRFALYAPRHVVRLTGVKTPADYAAYGESLKSLNDTLGTKGVTCGFLAMPTVNIGVRHPGCDYVCEDGSVRPFTACPRDPAFRALFVSNMTAIAAVARPPFLMLEDDFRFFGRGCFCDGHLAAFAAATGRRWTRDELRAALKPAGELQRHWTAFQTEAIVSLAADLERAIGAVSPQTRIGLSAPGGIALPDSLRIARAAAGSRRPFVRWYGIGYGSDVPVDCCGYLRSAQWAREHLDDGHEFFYEADAVPHTVLYGSAARMTALMEKAFSMGFDRMWFWGLGTGAEDLAESPDFLTSYRDSLPRFLELRRMGRLGRPVGVAAEGDWYAPLNRLGFPVTTGGSSVRFVSGAASIADMTDADVRELLAGKVVLDGSAASAVVARGFGDLLGIASCGKSMSGYVASSRGNAPPRFVDFSGERLCDGSWTSGHFECAFHQGYGLDSVKVADFTADGAEEVAYYYLETPERRVRPSILRFVNPAGGRVVVMAVSVWGLQSPNFFNFARRRILADLIQWLGGEDDIPVRTANGPTAYVLARETPEGLFVHVTNLSCDTRKTVDLAAASKWRNGHVELLDAKGRWRAAPSCWEGAGRTLRLTGALPVFGSLAFKIVPVR